MKVLACDLPQVRSEKAKGQTYKTNWGEKVYVLQPLFIHSPFLCCGDVTRRSSMFHRQWKEIGGEWEDVPAAIVITAPIFTQLRIFFHLTLVYVPAPLSHQYHHPCISPTYCSTLRQTAGSLEVLLLSLQGNSTLIAQETTSHRSPHMRF